MRGNQYPVTSTQQPVNSESKIMEIIKQYRIVIIIVATVLILVIIRSLGMYHFKSDAAKLAESSVMRANILTNSQVAALTGNKLLIYLGEEAVSDANKYTDGEVISIMPDAILSKENLKMIHRFKGNILLTSPDDALSARIWMVLSQMGIKDIYILSSENDNESFKNKFRPDTLTGPEL
jgi:hypothetical protein